MRLALCGAGAIGVKHAEAIAAAGFTLCAYADPVPRPHEPSLRGVPWHTDIEALIGAEHPDGIVIATPNALHRAHALSAIEAGIPALVEKPIALTRVDGQQIVDAARQANVPVAVGHHRRHGAALSTAKRVIEDGTLGTVRMVHCSAWLHKPDGYFDPSWRRSAGAGPILTNLIHDIDALRFLLGDIVAVEAMAAPSARGHEVEDAAAVLLRFASGVLGTVSVCDGVTAPWSWERTARENPMYPPVQESAIWIGGSDAGLSLPDLTLWRHAGPRDWTVPLQAERLTVTVHDPLVAQIKNFCAAIRGEGALVAPAAEGLKTLEAVDLVTASAGAKGVVAAQSAHCL
ncbi:MAG: Gfo/Idh/MocA family oxidoreductase [Pseudomonadota bacterium]